MNKETILCLPPVVQRVGPSLRTMCAMIKAGKFPAPVRLGARTVGWRSTDTQAWIERRAAAGQVTGKIGGDHA